MVTVCILMHVHVLVCMVIIVCEYNYYYTKCYTVEPSILTQSQGTDEKLYSIHFFNYQNFMLSEQLEILAIAGVICCFHVNQNYML